MKATSDVLNNISIESYEEIGETIVETYKKLTSLMNNDPKSDVVQSEFINIKNKLLDVFTKANISDTEYLNSESRINLFILRVISTLSIERTINMFFQKENALEYLKSEKPDGEIIFLAADPDCGKKGVGSLLLKELEKREQGKEIFLYTDNACTYQFYEHRDFERFAERQIVLHLEKEIALSCFFYRKNSEKGIKWMKP